MSELVASWNIHIYMQHWFIQKSFDGEQNIDNSVLCDLSHRETKSEREKEPNNLPNIKGTHDKMFHSKLNEG